MLFRSNNGDKIDGKTVSFTVTDYSPNSAFGYNLMTGKDLNFVSSDNPGVKKGAKVIVKVKEVKSLMGSWIITYEDLKEE